MKKLTLTILTLMLLSSAAMAGEKAGLNASFETLTRELSQRLPDNHPVFINDFRDINGESSTFGRYLSKQLLTRLANQPNLTLVQTRKEARFIVTGTAENLRSNVMVALQITDQKTKVLKGGVVHAIPKTREVASLLKHMRVKDKDQKEKEIADGTYMKRRIYEVQMEENISARIKQALANQKKSSSEAKKHFSPQQSIKDKANAAWDELGPSSAIWE